MDIFEYLCSLLFAIHHAPLRRKLASYVILLRTGRKHPSGSGMDAAGDLKEGSWLGLFLILLIVSVGGVKGAASLHCCV
jgi:hypothetical protein